MVLESKVKSQTLKDWTQGASLIDEAESERHPNERFLRVCCRASSLLSPQLPYR
jgi:hypothetical protein